MELLKKVLKSLLIGSLAGLGVALFTSFFFEDLIDRLENLTYYMRYHWEYQDLSKTKAKQQKTEEADYGVNIVDIDDRSMQKMGSYFNWDRSNSANMIRSLSKHCPAAIVFDMLFFDPEDKNKAAQLEKLLNRSKEVNPAIPLTPDLKNAIVGTINYDQQLIDATREAGNVIHSIQMSDESDIPEFARSSVAEKMTMEYHQKLNPASTLTLPADVRKSEFNRSNTKIILDGIFPPLAQAAENIGYVNMPPNEDGVTRKIPLMYAFGKNPPVYLPISVRTAVTVFGTPTSEIIFKPKQYLDIGKPFKVFKDSLGSLRCSYPTMSVAQLKTILDNAQKIMSLKPGERMEFTSFAKAGIDADGKRYVEMNAGRFPQEVLDAIAGADLAATFTLAAGSEKILGTDVKVRRDSDVDWVISAPWGDGEWYLSKQDLTTLGMVKADAFSGLTPGREKLVFHTFYVRNKDGLLVSAVPVLRGKTLTDLCATPWKTFEDLKPGTRIDFGETTRIPLDKDNQHILTFFGPRQKSFPYYSFYDVMNNRVQAALEGKIFLVGTSSASMNDIVQVAHDDNFPGVEVHASLLNSILTNTYIKRMTGWQDFIILLFVGIIIGFVAYMLKPLPGGILTVLAVFAYFVVAMTVFGSDHLWIQIARPILTILLTYTAAMAYRYMTEEKDRKFLQSTFKAYLSPELIDIMYKNKQMPMLGGDEGVRTAYFTDIQGFSTFSEKLGSPTRLVELLNEYLTAMTETLLSHYGTLDKYEGDAIIAFFGAPMPMADHAQQACAAALDMQKRLGELRKKWSGEGDKWPRIVHEMRMRIGVNSGPIVTGNMGSKTRMNYTMMGDAVNLAARLESASKQYGVYSMISQFTHDLVKDQYECRQLDKIQVVGKSEPVIVYELMSAKGELSPDIISMREVYTKGQQLYYSQQWDEAIAVLTESEKMEPYRLIAPKSMSPSKKLIEYCHHFKVNPPGDAWDGVIALSSK